MDECAGVSRRPGRPREACRSRAPFPGFARYVAPCIAVSAGQVLTSGQNCSGLALFDSDDKLFGTWRDETFTLRYALSIPLEAISLSTGANDILRSDSAS